MTTTLATTAETALACLGSADLSLAPGSPEFREHVERGAVELARIFRETTDAMRRAWAEIDAAGRLLDDTMKLGPDGSLSYRSFQVGVYYDGKRLYDHGSKSPIEEVIAKMNIQVWSKLVEKLGIKSLMSIQRRKEFDAQIEKGDVPPLTEENILHVLTGLADRAAEFATEAAKETLKLLTPNRSHYKTNSAFKVGKRAVLPYYVERGWSGSGFRVSYHRDGEINSIDATFHILDGKGVIKGHKGPLATAISEAEEGKGETDYFRFRCFKNRNLHIEFKRLDLVKQLNGLATGEYVLGQDAD